MRAGGLSLLLLLPISLVFVGPIGPWRAQSNTARVAPRVPRQAGLPGLQKARFMGRWVDWKPVMQEASKAEEVGGDMPLGIRFSMRDDGAFEITEIISGGSASAGTLEVQVGNIIHAVSCEVGGRKDVTTAEEVDSVEQMTQAILSNSDEVVMMLVEKPDEGAAGSISFLTNVAKGF
mmetsp:Transcript_86208/g.136946  ORF Transcript_86208/g.136946 Transcript_86208/m.136946 type:complete len:177 (+) Transcript_86208:102-632(+)